MTEELDMPLGKKKLRPKGAIMGRRVPWARLGLGLIVLVGIGVGAWIALVDDPMGGRPVAEAPVSAGTEPNPLVIEVGSQYAPGANSTSEPITPAISGTGPSIIMLDAPAADPDMVTSSGAYPDLIEETSVGALPRVSPQGIKPFEAYARPSVSLQSAGGRKLIAVVVTGLGLNEASTQEAIRALPGAVTLAFAPYGNNLIPLTAQAREAGHEIMLEIPLEPFDYPQNDPGPHTLLVEQPPRENLSKLYWLLSRIGGYTGVLNHMGARFTAATADFGPVMEELGLRGLAYLDDGSSNRSVAPQLARQNAVPFARADMELDTNPSRSAILQALAALEAQASERGWAVGTISALPVSIRTLAEWANGLGTGVVLVPVSAIASTGQ